MNQTPTHKEVVSFFKDNKLQEQLNMGLIVDAPLFWERIISREGEHPCLTIGEYKVIRRCVRDYDYSITELVPISESEYEQICNGNSW